MLACAPDGGENKSTSQPCCRSAQESFSYPLAHPRPCPAEFLVVSTRSLGHLGGVSMEESIFVPYLKARPSFRVDRDILRPTYLPDKLPHREVQIEQLVQVLVPALRGERPSNLLVYGLTGTGKTAVVKFLENELRKADALGVVHYLYLNCQVVDTPYGVLAHIANSLIPNPEDKVPFTGLSVDP